MFKQTLGAVCCAMLSVSGAQAGAAAAANPTPPQAIKGDWQEVRHGETVKDEYRWLQQKDSPQVKAHLDAENAYAEQMTASLKPLTEKLFQEMRSRIKETDLSVPVRRGGFYYYARTEAGKQYQIHCRRRAGDKMQYDEKAAEEVLLDVNQLAEGKKFMSVMTYEVSPDGRYLAYAMDDVGYRQYKLQIKDLQSGKLLPDSVERTTSFAWAADSKTLLLTQEDATTKRSDRVLRLTLGAKPEQVYYEPVEQFGLQVFTSKDHKYLMFSADSTDTEEVFYAPAQQPQAAFKSVLGRKNGHRYSVEHYEGQWLIKSNRQGAKEAKNFRLYMLPVGQTEGGQELVAHDARILLTDMEVFKGRLAVREKEKAQHRIRIYDFNSKQWQTLAMQEEVYSLRFGANPEYDSERLRFSYQSPLSPSAVKEVEMGSGKQYLLKQQEVLGGFDAGKYQTRRLWATAADGVQVPLWLVARKDIKLDGKNPLFLNGYGSYGIPSDPYFSSQSLSMLDRGVVMVTAQIRGGNDLGEAWHEDGMLMKKKNTFTDFISAAEHLIKEKWTSPDKLIIEGGSAGGLLVGAVLNMRPDLFKAAHAAVPFVDVMNTMMDSSLPLTAGEYLEWGNPNQKAAYDYMRSYSPYDNVKKQNYPALLVTTGFHDSQVMYWEPAKWVAKLRAHKTDNNPLLFKVNMHAGHGGASGRYDALREYAFEMAWMFQQWGLPQ
ncbi:S9 family peptidase [Massilia sp. W12]|uniref:S9 family peptidase n=1 Tax=Massilia sp. W12 TaxID=3126507 RepID=UPI0030CFC1FE